MRVYTRIHDPDTGAVLRNATSIDFGTLVPGKSSVILPISLYVEGAVGLSNITFNISNSKLADLNSGFLKYDKSLTFEKKQELTRTISSENNSVSLRSFNGNSSEILYLQIDTSLIGADFSGLSTGWKFSSVLSSSSSSSSSSNTCGLCDTVTVGQTKAFSTLGLEEICLHVDIESNEYCTLVVDGTNAELINDSGTLYLDGNEISVLLTEFTIGGVPYNIYIKCTDYDHKFTILFDLQPNMLFELTALTNSSSSSSSGSSSNSSSSSISSSSDSSSSSSSSSSSDSSSNSLSSSSSSS